jgi:hypothetical protein
MVGRANAWLPRALSNAAALVLSGLFLAYTAGGFSRSENRAWDVSYADVWRHLVTGPQHSPKLVTLDGNLVAEQTAPPPTAAELQANMEKARAGTRSRLLPKPESLARVNP